MTIINEAAILAYIGRFLHDQGYAPSVRDIRQGLAISSTSVVDYHLAHLEKNGLIRRKPHVARSIRLTHEGAFAAFRWSRKNGCGEATPKTNAFQTSA